MVKIYTHSVNEITYDSDTGELVNSIRREYVFEIEKGDDSSNILRQLSFRSDEIYLGHLVDRFVKMDFDTITTAPRSAIFIKAKNNFTEKNIEAFIAEILKKQAEQRAGEKADSELFKFLETLRGNKIKEPTPANMDEATKIESKYIQPTNSQESPPTETLTQGSEPSQPTKEQTNEPSKKTKRQIGKYKVK